MAGRLALALLLVLAGAARGGDRLEVRAVTANVRPPSKDDRDPAARAARLAAALAALKPDLVCLQEVDDALAARLVADLAGAGLAHARRLPSRLLVAARWPIAREDFAAFTLSGPPWRAEGWAGKGLARVGVDAPLGRVVVATTHLATDDLHRRCQALEAADAVGAHGASPPAQAFDRARPPVLLLGDLAAGDDDLARRLLAGRADLSPARGKAPPATSAVLLRPGGDVGVRATRVEAALAGEVARPGLLAVLELRRLDHAPRPDLRGASAAWRAVAAEARPVIVRDRAGAEARAGRGRTRGLVLAALGVALLALGRRRRGGRRGCLLPALGLAALHAATWFMVQGAVLEPYLAQALVKAERQLDD
ncbi:MAG: endonuclease/exonuclease/phosphatase family protein [Planctomycetes bacterium]|nr:endonuclease/exonuclease/phosphatase family protein [Planctomycetota bacterium]